MFRKYIKRENGKILEIIEEDAYGIHKTVEVIGTYDEPKETKKKSEK